MALFLKKMETKPSLVQKSDFKKIYSEIRNNSFNKKDFETIFGKKISSEPFYYSKEEGEKLDPNL